MDEVGKLQGFWRQLRDMKWEIERMEREQSPNDQRVQILETAMHTTEVAIRVYRDGVRTARKEPEKPVAEETEESNG